MSGLTASSCRPNWSRAARVYCWRFSRETPLKRPKRFKCCAAVSSSHSLSWPSRSRRAGLNTQSQHASRRGRHTTSAAQARVLRAAAHMLRANAHDGLDLRHLLPDREADDEGISEGRITIRGDQGRLLPRERVVPQPEVIGAIVLGGSPCCGRVPHPKVGLCKPVSVCIRVDLLRPRRVNTAV